MEYLGCLFSYSSDKSNIIRGGGREKQGKEALPFQVFCAKKSLHVFFLHVYSNFIGSAIQEVDDLCLVSLKIIILDYIWFGL